MKLELSDGNEEETSDDIKVKVWTERTKTWLEPPILVQKHELTRWNGEFEFEDGELWLQDGFCENWNEVNDCVSLLKGLEVDVTFDNIKVLTTFGLQFSIDPLLEEIGKWFKSILNTDNFGKTVNMIHKLKKLGFSEEQLTSKISLTPAVMEFVNNSSREDFANLLTAEFNELDMVILKALFRGENNHFDILLNTSAETMKTEEECQIILDLLQVMLSYVHPEILCVFSFEVDNVIEKMKFISSNNEGLLLSAFKFLAHLNKLKSDGLGTPRCVSLGVLQRTRCWRKYSLKQLQSLKDNENIRSWHLAEIVLDWIEQTDPPRGTVCELHDLVLLKLDNDVSRSPYPQYYRYRYTIDADFKRLSLRVERFVMVLFNFFTDGM
ncbi:uncharacterized protein LOC134819313 [Bolinopsis microptera]|uniref:uncharacterized protein LOC134819313 n=1 Tax=Bolinopsis microptera TaxID=2820187 RepID=UPI00307993E7